jgi:hypothetical protein
VGGAELTGAVVGPVADWQPLGDRFGRRDAEELAVSLTATPPTPADALRLAQQWAVADPPQVYELQAGARIGAGMPEQVRDRVHQLRQLDDHLGGADTYTTVTAELDGSDRARESALYLSWLAESLAQAREVDESAATALRVLELATSTSSDRARQRVEVLGERLAPWRGHPAVDEFRDLVRGES